jgi:excisionase family DNA binding protein
MYNELLTIDEVAKLLKVHKSHVFKLMKEGELPVVKRGSRYTRILGSDLMAFIQRHRTGKSAIEEGEQ